MAKHTLKILRCSHRKIFKVCVAIFQHYKIKGSGNSLEYLLRFVQIITSDGRNFSHLLAEAVPVTWNTGGKNDLE